MKKRELNMDFELLAGYLSGEASPDDKARFDNWLKSSPANHTLFLEYKKLWGEVGKVESVAGINIEQEWLKLESEIQELGSTPVISLQQGSSKGFVWLRTAVAVAIVLVLSVGGYFISGRMAYRTISSDNSTEFVILPDGSEVTLNVFSSMKYRKRFGKEERNVSLEGEAFFDVAREENRPFIIGADGVEVKVLGTSFNVNAYSNNKEIEVHVSTGKVTVTGPGDTPQTIILKPGNKGIFKKADQSLVISREIDKNYLSWKTKSFTFEDQSLFEVILILNRVYDAEITIISDSLKNARITTTFKDQTLEAILNVLSATLDLRVEENNGQILLKEGI